MPETYREKILMLYPNGSMPITAITSKMKSQKVEQPIFHWWEQTLPTQSVTVTAGEVYIDSAMATAYVRTTHQAIYGIDGGVVYVKMTLANSRNFKPGHLVLLRDASDLPVDVHGKVVSRFENGASSNIGVQLLEADDNGSTASSYNLATVDTVMIYGSAYSEGAERPEAVAYDPTERTSYCGLMRTAVDLTGTAYAAKLRTGTDPLREARRQALELHGIEMERYWIWGILKTTTGANGKPERYSEGIVEYIRSYASDNDLNYATDATYSGQTWASGGEDWLDASCATLFKYGKTEKLALCGYGALAGINRVAKLGGNINLTPKTMDYGLKVVEYVTPFGVLYLMRHPLFSQDATTANMMLVIEPDRLVYSYLRDTHLKIDKTWQDGGGTGLDAIQEEYLTEAGMEIHNPECFGILNGVGSDSTV